MSTKHITFATASLFLALTAPATAQSLMWVDTGQQADWAAHDFATTSGARPKRTVAGKILCGPGYLGYIAVCWAERKDGHPDGVFSDFPTANKPAAWCAYKNSSVKLASNPNGGASDGSKLYVCGRPIR